MSRQHTFNHGSSRMNDLCHHLEEKYQMLGYRTQILNLNGSSKTGCIFQVSNESEKKLAKYAKSAVGMGCTAQALITVQGDDLNVQVGQGRWIEKGALATLSMFVLWPLLVTSGIGAWKQHKLLDNLYQDITYFFAGGVISNNHKNLTNCPNCGTAVTADMKFCGACGKPLLN